jgi:hypothetical protein
MTLTLTLTLPDALTLARTKGERLYHTAGGDRFHISTCIHFEQSSRRVETTGDNVGTRTACVSYCTKELQGQGRQRPASREEAFRQFQLPVEAVPAARAALADVDHDEIWIPHSGSYIALGKDGYAEAWVLKSEVRHRDADTVALPSVDVSPVAATVRRAERPERYCDEHPGITLPLSGLCEECQ